MSHKLWTIGHSTRLIDEFIALLKPITFNGLLTRGRFPTLGTTHNSIVHPWHTA